MKRFLSVFLSIIVMVTMLVLPVSANSPTVTVSSITEAKTFGDEVEFKVSVSKNPGFTSFNWKVEYDTSRLKLKAFETTYEHELLPGVPISYLPNFTVTSNIETNEIACANANAFTTAEATVFALTFTVKENAPSGIAKVSVENIETFNGKDPVTFTYVSGTVNIKGDDCAGYGHDFDGVEWQTRIEPTCDDAGLEYRKCKRTGCTFEETKPIEKLGHSYGDCIEVDEFNHKQVCSNDSNHVIIGKHKIAEGVCAECGYEEPDDNVPSDDNTPTDNPPTDNPPTDNPPTDNPPTDNPPTTTPSTEVNSGWEDIKNEIAEAEKNETVVIEMNGTVDVPSDVFEQIAQKDVKIEFNMGNGISWTVNGKDVPENATISDINLDVKTEISEFEEEIPSNIIDEIQGKEKVQIELSHSGDFGFSLNLSVQLNDDYAGSWANLYYYNPISEKIEFVACAKIGEDGVAQIPFTHASNYVVVVDTNAHNEPTDNPPTDNPPTDNPPTDNPPTDNPPTDNPPTDNPPTDNPPTDNPPTDNPPTDNPPTDNPPTDNPPTDNPPTDNPPTDNPPTDNPPTDNPPTDNPPTDNPPTDNPPTDNPPTDNPPTDNPPTDNPPTDNPPTDNPPTDNPPTDNPPTDNPPIDDPCATGHDMSEATCTEPATCKRGCGHTEGTSLGHDMSEATCTVPATCNRGCGHTEGTALGHDMSEATCTEPATCKRGCGHTEGTALGHDYGEFIPDDANNHKKVCANNGNHIITEAHTWDAFDDQHCTVCNYIRILVEENEGDTTPDNEVVIEGTKSGTTLVISNITIPSSFGGATISLDLAGATGVSDVQLNNTDLGKIKDEGKIFEIIMPNASTITFDAAAITEILAAVPSGSVSIKVVKLTDGELSSAQFISKNTLSDSVVYKVSVVNDATGEEIPDFATGTITVNASYTKLQTGTVGAKFLDKDGAMSDVTYSYDDTTKVVTLTTNKPGEYVIYTAVQQISYPTGGGGGGGVSSYSVKFETNGATAINKQTVRLNGRVTKPQNPAKEGYIFDGWYLDEKLTQPYDFNLLVKRSFTLYAKWTPTEEKFNEITLPFSDVKETDWFSNAVKFAYINNLVNGISSTEFAPNSNLTRAMLVTIIYRLAGEPAVNKSVPFGDVGLDAYYASAVSWAQQNEIVNGISETQFAPNYNITREQIAAIIYRYSQNKGYDVSKAENVDLSSYKDADEISEYAVLAMKYAVGSGLMGGRTATTLNPKDNATRAEVVQVFYNLLK